ncbi:MAG: FAD-dependent urate hydroxylase HpxO [Nodosilinea sp.]
MNNLKVIIIGAGMGGLATAIAMTQAGYAVEVYDRVGQLRPAGAGISLWSNGVKVLNHLGMGQEIAALGGAMQRITYLTQTGATLTDFSLDPLVRQVGQCPYPVARTDLQGMLLLKLGADRVHLRSHCIAIEQTATSATAIFEDGRRATGDLVVGADGTHSKVREFVLGHSTERRYTGYVNWNGLVPHRPDLAPAHSWVIYVGQGQRASMMPVGGDRLYFFLDVPLAFPSPAPSSIGEELKTYFADWPPAVQTLITVLDPATTNRIPIHDIDPLPHFARGRVVLLGDAAHSTTPDLGQGGCQALEDAWVLTKCLLTNNLGVIDALQRYEAARQDRTANLILKARKRANLIHGQDVQTNQQWYKELAQEDGGNIMAAIAKVILEGPLN